MTSQKIEAFENLIPAPAYLDFVFKKGVCVGLRHKIRAYDDGLLVLRFGGYEISGGWAYSPLIYGPELFEICYRTKACSRCLTEKLAQEFDWKVRGNEGPFIQACTGRRDSFCKVCRSSEKSARYKRDRKAREKKERRLRPRKTVVSIDDFRVTSIFDGPMTAERRSAAIEFTIERLLEAT